jgi:hypothetical protein
MESLQGTLGSALPGILGAVAILLIGWFLAVAVRAGINRGLKALKVNDRVGDAMDLENAISQIVFWVVMAFVLIGVFNALNLETVSRPLDTLVSQVTGYLPKLVSGLAIAVLAWVIATAGRTLVTKGLAQTTLDEKLARDAGMAPISANAAAVVYWLVILLFLPIVLGVLGLQGLLAPVQTMVEDFLVILPNVFGALVIGFVGWFIAKILREIVTNLSASAGMDKVWEKAGLTGTTKLSGILGLLVFIFVFVPALIAAFEKLDIQVISAPATDMLGMFLTAVPNIIAAALILAATWFVARFISQLLQDVLKSMGFDEWPQRMGLDAMAQSGTPLSQLSGRLVVFFAMLFATVEAANRLGFYGVRDVATMFIRFGGQILLGGIIFAVGFWLASVAHKAIVQVGGQAGMANVARFAVVGLVLAMGLRAMGIADDIVNLAFGLILGSVAVAVALSFGLGGREAAGEQMTHWLRQLRGE